MARNGVHVRRADKHDLETVLELTSELREELLRTRNRSTTRTPADRYAEVLADDTCEIALAVVGEGAAEVVLGMAVLSVARTNALLELPSLHVTHVVVSAAHRRRGPGAPWWPVRSPSPRSRASSRWSSRSRPPRAKPPGSSRGWA